MPLEAVIPVQPMYHPWWRERQLRRSAAWAGVVALAGVAAALGAAAEDVDPADNALLRGALVAAPLSAGVYARQARLHPAFARLLVAAGITAFISTFAEASAPALYTVGRSAGWALELLVVVMLLGFPSGDLRTAADRALTRAMAIAIGAFLVPTLLLAETLPLPSPYTSCVADCPASILRLDGIAGAGAGRLLSGLGALAVFAVTLGVAVRLHQRIRAAGRVEAGVLWPVLMIALARAAVLAIGLLSHEIAPHGALDEVCMRIVAWCIPLIAVAFLLGLVRLRLYAGLALQRLVAGAQASVDLPTMQRAFGEALDDPTLELHVVPSEHPATKPPPPAPGRVVCEVDGRDGTVVAVLARDAPLAGRADLLEAAGRLAAVGLERLRLTVAAEQSDREISRSRARIAATAERERRRIERDLHDGAQQRLVALRIELALVEDLLLSGDLKTGAARLHDLGSSVDAALEELRALAHGVCPPLLADRGLREALRAATTRCVVPTRLIADGVGRYSPEVESAVYFSILEALQNIAKHARGARRTVVWLRDDGRGRLAFSVRDDGAGVHTGDRGEGDGLLNMRDRLASVGGGFELLLVPGRGGEARGSVPLDAPDHRAC
jgi:signal transduction histidine kinase